MNRQAALLISVYGSVAAASAADSTHSANLWKPLSLAQSMITTAAECAAGEVVIDLAEVAAPKSGEKHEARVVKVNEAGTFGTVTIANQGGLVMLVTADTEAKKLITGDQVEFRKCGGDTKAAPTPAPKDTGR